MTNNRGYHALDRAEEIETQQRAVALEKLEREGPLTTRQREVVETLASRITARLAVGQFLVENEFE